MPASDLVWNVPQTLPVFQVYGTKRKSSYNEESEPQGDMDVEMRGSGKKRCVERTEPEGIEINHNDPQLHSAHQFQPQPTATPDHQMMEEEMGATFQNNSYPVTQPHQSSSQCTMDPYPAHSTHENDMVMDLCDETYTTVPRSAESDAETEAAQNSMDSDFTPNPHQYSNNFTAYNNSYVDEGSSSVSQNVRCYCKPTWEGLMDLRPYVSDYY